MQGHALGELPAVSPINVALTVPASLDSGNGHAGPRVLIVEGHADTAEVLSALLGASGHTVKTVGSAAAALKFANEEPFDVIVSTSAWPMRLDRMT